MKIEIDESKLFKGFAKGYYDPEHGGRIIMYADELYKNNRPYVEFCNFCILRNLIVPATEDYLFLNPDLPKDSCMFLIDSVYILESDNEERNKEISEMLKKYVSYHEICDRESFELEYRNVFPLKEIKPTWLKSKYIE